MDNLEGTAMKWIILVIVVVVVGIWLSRGRKKNDPSDPDAKSVEQKDYYISPEEEGKRPHHPDRPEQTDRQDSNKPE